MVYDMCANVHLAYDEEWEGWGNGRGLAIVFHPHQELSYVYRAFFRAPVTCRTSSLRVRQALVLSRRKRLQPPRSSLQAAHASAMAVRGKDDPPLPGSRVHRYSLE